jgi:hypothetical protein
MSRAGRLKLRLLPGRDDGRRRRRSATASTSGQSRLSPEGYGNPRDPLAIAQVRRNGVGHEDRPQLHAAHWSDPGHGALGSAIVYVVPATNRITTGANPEPDREFF